MGGTPCQVWPVAQLYGQDVRTGTNALLVIDWSLSHLAGHKPFTCSHCVVWLYVTLDLIFTSFIKCVFLPTSLCMHLQPRGVLLAVFSASSAVSKLSSDWRIGCLLRYVCFGIVVMNKSLFVLLVDRCCRFASLKQCRTWGNKLYSVTSQIPCLFCVSNSHEP